MIARERQITFEIPIRLVNLEEGIELNETWAAEQGKASVDHLAHLAVHATLHLLGYTHDAEADAARMESLETRVLAGLGIPDPYLVKWKGSFVRRVV